MTSHELGEDESTDGTQLLEEHTPDRVAQSLSHSASVRKALQTDPKDTAETAELAAVNRRLARALNRLIEEHEQLQSSGMVDAKEAAEPESRITVRADMA